MRKLIFTLVLIVFAGTLLAQGNLVDVLYLKNGTIIRGIIIEQVPDVSVKIQTADGRVALYAMSEVSKITRERVSTPARQRTPRLKKPGLAFMMSFLVPGLGQYYNGDVAKGLAQEAMVLGGTALAITAEATHLSEFVVVTGIGIAGAGFLWTWIDAPISASRKNQKIKRQYGHLFEFDLNGRLVGIDNMTKGGGVGTQITIHF
jgi:TM2 domain-containing membrane protein YozV